MTYNFEIKVQCKGYAVGTMSWLHSILENSELIVKNTKDGTPGLFMFDKKSPEKKGTFICSATNDEMSEGYERLTIEGVSIIRVFPVSDQFGFQVGFVDYPLTPVALDIAKNFLEKASEQFAKWWNNQ